MEEITVHYTSDYPPRYHSEGAAGCDLLANLEEELTIEPGHHVLVPTGVRLQIPQGYEAQVRPRSGLAANQGVTLLNAPGTIDSDYRGEIKVALVNFGGKPFVVKRGDRIAQIVFSPIAKARFEFRKQLDATVRGEKGFGSTGRGNR
jgi:dUTP pyrophosphatase